MEREKKRGKQVMEGARRVGGRSERFEMMLIATWLASVHAGTTL